MEEDTVYYNSIDPTGIRERRISVNVSRGDEKGERSCVTLKT